MRVITLPKPKYIVVYDGVIGEFQSREQAVKAFLHSKRSGQKATIQKVTGTKKAD